MNEKDYLAPSEYINWNNPEILALADKLFSRSNGENDLTKISFEWVRDNIKHSAEFKLNPVTCKASDVLKYRTGYCFAKSHLLAALLRANRIPAGLCYQRLSIDGIGAPFCLHGLNAVFLKEFGWYRVDSRGNNQKVNAQFIPPQEQLAFQLKLKEELDLPKIWKEPMPEVIAILVKYKTYQEVLDNLPDMDIRQS